jgi:hypothetical protein
MKRYIFNLWQFACVLTRSIFDKSLQLHLPRGREIKKDWPGENQETLFCIASLTVPLTRIRFSGAASNSPFYNHRKYKFFQSIISGNPLQESEGFLRQELAVAMDKRLYLARKLEILRLAQEGNAFFDVSGIFWLDGSTRIHDGEHRILALAALGKREIRIGMILENPNRFTEKLLSVKKNEMGRKDRGIN